MHSISVTKYDNSGLLNIRFTLIKIEMSRLKKVEVQVGNYFPKPHMGKEKYQLLVECYAYHR